MTKHSKSRWIFFSPKSAIKGGAAFPASFSIPVDMVKSKIFDRMWAAGDPVMIARTDKTAISHHRINPDLQCKLASIFQFFFPPYWVTIFIRYILFSCFSVMSQVIFYPCFFKITNPFFVISFPSFVGFDGGRG